MKVHVDLTALKRTKWYEYMLRFLFGGLITAIASVIAKKLGPEIGGAFLGVSRNFSGQRDARGKTRKGKETARGI
jgi:hypothetical protein